MVKWRRGVGVGVVAGLVGYSRSELGLPFSRLSQCPALAGKSRRPIARLWLVGCGPPQLMPLCSVTVMQGEAGDWPRLSHAGVMYSSQVSQRPRACRSFLPTTGPQSGVGRRDRTAPEPSQKMTASGLPHVARTHYHGIRAARESLMNGANPRRWANRTRLPRDGQWSPLCSALSTCARVHSRWMYLSYLSTL